VSRIKVDALQGTSGSDTAITLSGANATVGGTLSVTGVHTIGTNAVATSDGGAATTSIVQGLAKAWSRFNGTGTVAIDDSFNIASITDDSTGQYSLAISNDMANADYAKVTGGGAYAIQQTGDTASVADFHSYSSSPAYADYTDLQFVIHGDLA